MMKKVVLAGAGSRSYYMFALPFTVQLKESVQLCGVFDRNSVRARLVAEECGVPAFDSFAGMIADCQPDLVVVATTDSTHHDYIIAGLEAGCDVVSEKPMTIDAEKCRAILEAEQRTGRKVTVTFNLRFMPYFARVKQLLNTNIIGEIKHISFEYNLDRAHGADYFRRWHSELEKSGGLLVHKSSHHFDIANWWLGSEPKQIQAFGTRTVFGPSREERGERCSTCQYAGSCEYYIDYREKEFENRFFLQAEHEDGYIRDRCVFHEDIDIWDTMAVQVKYENQALLSYSLVTFSPDEGWRATITGTAGKMQLLSFVHGPQADTEAYRIQVIPATGEAWIEEVPIAEGMHGGGDERLLQMIFAGGLEDGLRQMADSRAGALALLTGVAANQSILHHKLCTIDELDAFPE